MKERENFSFKNYWGPNEYRERVVFERGTDMYCVYCGKSANTREHCPSKVFLKKPYPTNLPTVPACFKCNNGFSSDELYTKAFLLLYEQYCSHSLDEVLPDRKEVKEAQLKFDECIDSGVIRFDDRIANILVKLAICHMTYELTMGFYNDNWDGIPELVSYVYKPNMKHEEIEIWDDFIPMNDKIMPKVGSRIFDRIYVVETQLQSIEDPETAYNIQFAVMEWNDVQANNYRYVSWLENNRIHNKIVIDEFLYAHVIFCDNLK